MESGSLKCNKCNGEMVFGFIADYSDKSHFVSQWVEGEPFKKRFLGIEALNVETTGRKIHTIRTARCEKC